jgi:hypothetical protein
MPKNITYSILTFIKKNLKNNKLILKIYIFKLRKFSRMFELMLVAIKEFLKPLPLKHNKLAITKKESTFFGDGVATIRFSEHLKSGKLFDAYEGAWEQVNSSWLTKTKVDIRLRAHICTWAADQVKELEGDFFEFGTYFGILPMTICRYLNFENLDKKFFLYDTWGPLPGHHASYPDDIYEIVQDRFSKYGNVEFVRGLVPDSIDVKKIDKVAYMSLDMNDAEPEKLVLELLYEKVVKGGIIYFDDYGWGEKSKQREVVDDFFKDKREKLLHFPSGNSIIIKK